MTYDRFKPPTAADNMASCVCCGERVHYENLNSVNECPLCSEYFEDEAKTTMSDDFYKFSLEDLRTDLKMLEDLIWSGCGNHGCKIRPVTGQGTNGSCHCSPRHIAEQLLSLAIRTEEMGSQWKRDY